MPAVQRSCDRLFHEEAGGDRALKLMKFPAKAKMITHCNFSVHEGVMPAV